MNKKIVGAVSIVLCVILAMVVWLIVDRHNSAIDPQSPVPLPNMSILSVDDGGGETHLYIYCEGSLGIGDADVTPQRSYREDIFLMHEVQIRSGASVVFSETVDTGKNPLTNVDCRVFDEFHYYWPETYGERWTRAYWEARTDESCALMEEYAAVLSCGPCQFCIFNTDDKEIVNWWTHQFDFGNRFYLPVNMNSVEE
jgi:hypothetical protein